MVSYDRTDYLYVFIPAMISLFACFLLIVSVVVQPPLRDRMYHRLSVALASSQIIMYLPRIMDRQNTPLTICKVQDYMFQFGQCLTCVTITAINAYVFYVLYTTTLPDNKTFYNIMAGLVIYCVLNICIAISVDTASMFCGNDENTSLSYNDFDNGNKTQGIVFRCTYFYPLIFLLLINVIFSCFCVFQMVYRVSENKFKLPLLKRLLTFTLIFIVCGIPKIVSMFFFDDVGALANISDTIIHFSGVLLSGSYFYYAVIQDKRRWQTHSLLRETLLNLDSSTPAGVECEDDTSSDYYRSSISHSSKSMSNATSTRGSTTRGSSAIGNTLKSVNLLSTSSVHHHATDDSRFTYDDDI